MMKISILIPVYNEEKTIIQILSKISKVKLPKEIIVVDDASTDNTKNQLKKVSNKYKNLKIFFNKKNRGKGFCIRKALKHSNGNIIITQDADLEYNPKDYHSLIKPLIENSADVVYGSRFLKAKRIPLYYHTYLGTKFLTFLTNLLFNSGISDESTGYKIFKSEVIKNLKLRCNRFDFCPEVTAKVSKKGYRIKEVQIDYSPRTFEEGKKIRFKDGIIAVWTLIKFRFTD